MIEVQNAHDYTVQEARLREAAQAAIRTQDAPPDSALTIVITDNATVADLNRRYRQIDSPTDVLSFPAEMSGYLGDLLIAHPYAAQQALREGHDLQDSLALLVVHGTLHLLGFDHDTPENRAIMWAVQAQVLRQLGISTEIVPALEAADE